VFEIRHIFPIEVSMGRMGDGLVKRMGADADAPPAQVEFSHVDGVESGIPRIAPLGQDVFLGDGVAVQGIFRHIPLPGTTF
jgi:hypothetical protein